MPEIPLPYERKIEPVVERVPYNGANFFTATWKVPESVKYRGKIIYVHGFCEHSEVYAQVFDFWAEHGFEVFFLGQRGAGETSPGKDAGRTDEFHTFDDLDFFIKRNLDAREDKLEKFIMAGHSMGGGISLNYGIRGKYRDDFKAIVTTGPLVLLHPKTQPNIILRTFQPFVTGLLPNFKMNSDLKYDHITSDEAWKDYIKKHDKKFIGTIRQLSDMITRGEELVNKEYAAKFSPDIRLLICHGNKDYINDVEGSKKFLSVLPDSVKAEFFEVEGGRHSLFIERDELRIPVFERVLKFLEEVS